MPLTVNRNGNPIKITGTTATDTEIIPDGQGITHIKFVRWYKPTTVGHLCHITDGQGNTIIHMYCDTANKDQMWPIYTSYGGISCDDMDSGTLYIHIV